MPTNRKNENTRKADFLQFRSSIALTNAYKIKLEIKLGSRADIPEIYI